MSNGAHSSVHAASSPFHQCTRHYRPCRRWRTRHWRIGKRTFLVGWEVGQYQPAWSMGRFCTWPHRRERCQLFRGCSFALVGFSPASPSGSKAGDKRQGADQRLSAAGLSLVRSGQIYQSVGSVEPVVDSTCRQGAPCLHWSPACEFVRLPGGGWFGLPPVVSLLVLFDTLGFAKTLLAPQTVHPVGHWQ